MYIIFSKMYSQTEGILNWIVWGDLTMDRRLLLCLLVTLWVNGQSQIPTGDLAVMGFLGTVGISGKFVLVTRY